MVIVLLVEKLLVALCMYVCMYYVCAQMPREQALRNEAYLWGPGPKHCWSGSQNEWNSL